MPQFDHDPEIMQRAQKNMFEAQAELARFAERAEKRRARELLRSASGTVRMGGTWLFIPVLLAPVCFIICQFAGLFLTPAALTALVAVFVAAFAAGLLYMLWWRLDFDASTGFIQHRSLFGGTKSYHVTELMCFEVKCLIFTRSKHVLPSKIYNETTDTMEMDQNPSRRSSSRNIRVLCIEAGGRRIYVPLSASGSNSRGDLFYDYLRFYRRYVLESPELLDELDAFPDRKENGYGI